jgi:hypothetical protein
MLISKFFLIFLTFYSIIYIYKKYNSGTSVVLYVKEIYADDNRYCKDLTKPFYIYLDISDQYVPEFIEIRNAFNFSMVPENETYKEKITFFCTIVGPTETLASYIICELNKKFPYTENVNFIMEKYDDEKKFSFEYEGELIDFTIELFSLNFEIGNKKDDYCPVVPKIISSQVINYSESEEQYIDFSFDTKLKEEELPGIILHDNSIEKSLIELNCTKNATNILRCFLYNETVPGPFDDYKIYSMYYKNLCGFKENMEDTLSVTSEIN